MDAMKTIQLAAAHNNTIAGVIVNMSNYGWNELKPTEIEQMLGHPILANIRHDRKFRKALMNQTPLHHSSPNCRSSREFRKVATHLCAQEERIKE
jgi:MinD-like ATPase involved in chromosome partitioning or flagellar assembly